ncbi:penicillin-binding transpeptidase domain-containing protein [Vagococcus vulneris]|uniref:Cell division protein FtsI n=1 Tax=Vagococcus vulneris TaxID=1977869 RepID=A0A429ZZQ8_9ENTE|nr:penicillin-binding transpeptidase domain-containing protein [Vagococcus vulneris]RST99493.1 hypothetical protein CBF37_03985 [Vagococcus vulneris]
MQKRKREKQSFLNWKKSNANQKGHIPLRLDILFFIVFILFFILIVRLGDLQLMQKDKFQKIVETGQKSMVKESAPRGYIYDSKGKILVGNTAKQSIIFTRSPGLTAGDIRNLSNKITSLIDIKPDDLSERDKKDYWLSDSKHLEEAAKRVKHSDKFNKHGEQLSDSALYPKIVDAVKSDEVQFDEADLKRATIFKRINSAGSLQSVVIKNDNVTPEEIAVVGENASTVPGIGTGTDWDRDYPENDQIRSILGVVSSEKQGLPNDRLDQYLKQGYERNDRVGLSYLENSYEDTLRGQKGESEVVIDKNQKIMSKKEVKSSEKGDNLKLTIDLDFQKKVEEITRGYYNQLIGSGQAALSEGIYVVVTEPKTGNVLSMVGIDRDVKTGKLTDDTIGTFTKSFVPGSSIKAATIMAGYENDVIKGNQKMVDEPIFLDGGQKKSSLFNPYGSIALTTEQALEVSSNTYMMKIALGMMGVTYEPYFSLPMRTDVFDKLRKTYGQFGLGVSTGLDLPNETEGIVNKNFKDKDGNYIPGIMGSLLDLSYGNYDTYTPMQLNQYVSTIANKGTRIAPHVVEGVYGTDGDGELGDLKEKVEPKILSKIENKGAEFDIIEEGMKRVVTGPMGTATKLYGATTYPIAAKTGTAETVVQNPNNPKEVINAVNSTMVGYAPVNNPEVAVSIVIPTLTNDDYGVNADILRDVINAFFANKDNPVSKEKSSDDVQN